MRKLFYLFIVAGVLFSCQSNNKYTIEGTVVGDAYEGTNVLLQQMSNDALVAIDTAVIKNGTFSFSGVADSVRLRFITLDESINPQQENMVPMLVESGNMAVNFDTIVTVTGTKVNEVYSDFRRQQRALSLQMKSIRESFDSEKAAGTMTEARDEELRASYDAINDQLTDLDFNFIKDNIGNQLGEFIFRDSYSKLDEEKQKAILDLASEEFKADAKIQRLIKRLENYEKVKVGNKFIDFTLNDPEGKEVSLSDFAGKGNYVLIDFWASWCGPCVREMPNVVAAYEKYKSKGFQVVGVSLDQEHESWVKGIKDLNMTWPQMSDLQYWKSPVVDLYAFNGIPHTVLLDKDGTILEKNLRGEALDAKLSELMP